MRFFVAQQNRGGIFFFSLKKKGQILRYLRGHRRSTVSANEREEAGCRLVSGDGGPARAAGHVRLHTERRTTPPHMTRQQAEDSRRRTAGGGRMPFFKESFGRELLQKTVK